MKQQRNLKAGKAQELAPAQIDTCVLNIPEAARTLGVSESTVRRMIGAREIGSVRIRERIGITNQQLATYLSRVVTEPIDATAVAQNLWNKRKSNLKFGQRNSDV